MSARIFGGIAIFFLFAGVTLAATDEFIITTQITGVDTTPPTTPLNLTATPVATTQIDLAWSASTDDTLLSGYQIFRDAAQIATTTLTAYSDTGLTASTTYAYTVTAFDSSFNYSTTSAIASTTTLPIVITPTSTPTTTAQTPSTSGPGDLVLQSFDVIPSERSAQFSWRTNQYVQFELRWGRTSAYELGFVTNTLFKREHETSITDLQSGTTYEYVLTAYKNSGQAVVLSRGQFTTTALPDTTPPSNVSGLRADVLGSDVQLSWLNPKEDDFAYVRVVRSHLFFPLDPRDGYVVYQGAGESVQDRSAFIAHKKAYYTVFTYDVEGNISSGAVVIASTQMPEGAGPIETTPEPTATSTRAIPLTIDFSDVTITQNGTTMQLRDGQIFIDQFTPFIIALPYHILPEHLKTITVTLTHPEDTSLVFSFLLRINKDKTAYEAQIAPFGFGGVFDVAFSVFDFNTEVLTQFGGEIVSTTIPEVRLPSAPSSFFIIAPRVIVFSAILLFLIFLFILYFVLLKRRSRDEY